MFGVGLQSKEDGESVFLPKIGEAHVAALPYEIILQGKKLAVLLPSAFFSCCALQ